MLLAAAAAPVDRAGTRFGAPFFACTWLESAIARDHSISPAACNSASRSSCSRCQTPASCQTRNLRQHVIPQPKPSSCGRCSHPIPVCKTNKIPCNASRSSNGFAARIPKTALPPRQQRLDPTPQRIRHIPRLRTHRHPRKSLTTDTDGLRPSRTGPFIQLELLKPPDDLLGLVARERPQRLRVLGAEALELHEDLDGVLVVR